MIKMCFFDKSSNSMRVNTFKQLLSRRDREKFSRVAYPVNGCIPIGHASMEVHKKHETVGRHQNRPIDISSINYLHETETDQRTRGIKGKGLPFRVVVI